MAVMSYRTRDGLADYGFSIDYQPDTGWRAYIVFRPLDQDQGDDLRLPYEAVADDQRRYVDWPDKLESLGEAKTVAALWAELVQGYRRDQEQKALVEDLIERARRDHQRKRTASAGPDRPGGNAGESAVARQAGEPGPSPAVIPPPRLAAVSFDTLSESA